MRTRLVSKKIDRPDHNTERTLKKATPSRHEGRIECGQQRRHPKHQRSVPGNAQGLHSKCSQMARQVENRARAMKPPRSVSNVVPTREAHSTPSPLDGHVRGDTFP